MSTDMRSLLDTVVEKDATDLHLEVGQPPMIRVKGVLEPLGSTPLAAADTIQLRDSITHPDYRPRIDAEGHVEFGFGFGDPSRRFLVTAFRHGEEYGLILRSLLPYPGREGCCPACGAPLQEDSGATRE